MKRIILPVILLLSAASSQAKTQSVSVIPQPNKVTFEKGFPFKVKGAGINCDPSFQKKSIRLVETLGDRLYLVTGKAGGIALPKGLQASADAGKVKGMAFIRDKSMAPESYSLDITKDAAIVRAADHNGLLYAIQTIKQMLPTAIYGNALAESEKWYLPCCKIEDSPRFAYRGVHLDCCRHFFSVKEVKKYLDVMAICKCNRLHWHLSEDQGWRIEIKKYPLLTEVGAYRRGTQIGRDRETCDNIRYGGFYTQEQIRDIIAYADNLGITIIPEIDLPGHMQAALTAYPELGCKGSKPYPYEVWTKWGISKQVLCVGKESTMKFLEDVLSEVADLFPGEYIHIGGDECPKEEWKTDPDCQAKIRELGLTDDAEVSAEQKLQNYVTARMQAFLAGKGKKVIGWDEVLEGNLAKGATVMSWRGSKGGIKAASMGYDVIMTPNTYCYFDYAQSPDLDKEPLGITKDPKRAVTLEKVYGWNPCEEMPETAHKHVLGAQCNLWTEYIASPEHLQYMLLPRLFALSEVQWCKPEAKDYDRFVETLREKSLKMLDILGYNYRRLD